MATVADRHDREVRLTPHVSVLVGRDNGKYPSGNSLVVHGEYRACVDHVFAGSVERHCAAMHVQRLLVRGEVVEVAPNTYRAC
jgi:hypothetical protein